MKKLALMILIISFIPLFTSCGSSSRSFVDRWGAKCNKMPKWVTKLPKKKGMIHAVGFAMPDPYPERSLEAAQTKARLELSKTLETQIKVDSQTVDEFIRTKEGEGAQNIDRTTVIRSLIKEQATKIVTGSKIEETFYDNCNFANRGEGAYFVLASLPK
ncbi:LPP20 family lipoprotein [bacterium]|nr:LPP20 family lipoprotein [bacterium]